MLLRDRRIGLLTASASRLGGGVFEAVIAQAALIASLGGRPLVFALDDDHAAADRPRIEAAGGEVRVLPISGPPQVGFAPALVPAMIAARLDCLHLHGIWMYPSRAGAVWARRTGRPYFVSPHGMLDPWITGRGKLKKAIARMGYERTSWARATALHALTPRESADILRESGRSDSVVIPNAGPEPRAGPPAFPAPAAVYIGRIHTKKNLVALVEGWAVAQRPAGATLTIAGWGDEADVAALRGALDAAGECGARFVGPIYGAEKQALIDGARFVVLPSHSEGLPMAMLEAWAAGVPTMMTAECNLAEGFAAGAAIECGYNAPAIAAAIGQALAIGPEPWAAMSSAALSLASGPFSASTVAERWGGTYASAIARAHG